MPRPLPVAPPDPSLCPLCGAPNVCAMELEQSTGQPQPPCWCTQVAIDSATLARIPPQAQNLACICPRCAAQAVPPASA
ncbi:cysteine-rich CWC family protein [Rhodoferax sp.]|uniref:cysteine-rich CWC family protein n=1 Tax=Rhodoferax sp. TaxID=50421 RepID=UPI00374CF066